MADKKEKLFSDFSPVSTEQWMEKVTADLKGADFEKKLVWKTNEGFKVKPFYRMEDLEGLKTTNALPGEFPYLRGTKKNNNEWLVRQEIKVECPKEANAKALDILNKGVEVTVSGQIVKTKDFKLNVSINAAYNANKLVEYNSPYSSYSSEQEGYPISSLFSGICNGIDPKLGIYTYKLRSDTDRKENNYRKDSDNYRFYIGTSNAPINGGYSINFSYKQFSLGVSGNYSIGNKINSEISSPAYYSVVAGSVQNNPQTSRSDLYVNHLNVSKDVVNRWTESNPITNGYPRLVDAYGTKISIDGKFLEDYTTTLSYITNGAFIENISYFKISNIYLNYSFPDAQWMRKARITSFGLTASVSNVCIFSNYSGIDPETPGAVYPQARNFTLGLNIGF